MVDEQSWEAMPPVGREFGAEPTPTNRLAEVVDIPTGRLHEATERRVQRRIEIGDGFVAIENGHLVVFLSAVGSEPEDIRVAINPVRTRMIRAMLNEASE